MHIHLYVYVFYAVYFVFISYHKEVLKFKQKENQKLIKENRQKRQMFQTLENHGKTFQKQCGTL